MNTSHILLKLIYPNYIYMHFFGVFIVRMGMLRFLWLFLIQILFYLPLNSIYINGQRFMKDECSLLFKLKLNLEFDPSYHTQLESWNSSTYCCLWIGVTCENNHIVAVDLENKNIIGGLDNSSSLFDLQHLQQLNLAFNNFSAPIPEAVARLVNLEYLDLQYGGFVGQIPAVIANMKKLQVLDLSYNWLTVEPSTLGLIVQGLSSLKELILNNVDLSGNVSNSMGSLRQLSKLYLRNCNLTGFLPRWIGNLTQLEYLSLSGNNFTGPLLDLSNIKNLRYINLRDNFLTGALPSSLFTLPSIRFIDLSYNQFSGTLLDNHSLEYSSTLQGNKLQGPVPMSLYNLENLCVLDLSFNNFSGTIELTDLMRLPNLESLYLSYNNLSISIKNINSPSLSHGIYQLSLASCNLTVFPNLVNQPMITYLDLSNNHLQGEIPSWIWDIPNVLYIDLNHNMLTGQLPPFPQLAMSIDYSFNRFNSTIPPTIGKNLGVLNLSNNKLKGAVPGNISGGCSLGILDLSNNMLEGEVPITLANCARLEVVNLGNNRIHDRFPCWLKRLPNLQVLILKSNEFNGRLKCPNTTNLNLWQSLHIIDLANNYFFGDLPSSFFPDWKAMTLPNAKDHPTPLQFSFPRGIRQQQPYTVTIVMSGEELKLDDLWNECSSIDLSSNMFSGEIPVEIGRLSSLHAINLSHNALTGPIPSTIGNMTALQWLDFSHNSLDGTIPGELATLNSLAILNLSFNQLKGVIPTGPQFETFPETAFVGNEGLCGFPLHRSCVEAAGSSLPPNSPNRPSHGCINIKWDLVIGAEVGFIFGLLISIGPLVLFRRWSRYYFMHLDIVLKEMFGLRRLMERPARRPIRSLTRYG